MENEVDKEDILIRRLLIAGACLSVVTLLAIATIVTVMISANFNILEWME